MADVSRNVVAVLLVLVIAVSGFGTWSVLSSEKPQVASNSNYASVNLDIQQVPQDSGTVALNVGGSNG